MEKEQFLDAETTPWWLVGRDLEEALDLKRKALGEACGWTDPNWYLERTKLEELYQFLETNKADLLKEPLDQATDLEKRQQWLDTVIELKAPPKAPGGATPPPAAVTAPPKAPETPAARAGATAEAPARKPSAFGRKTTEDAGAPAGTPAADTPAAQTSEAQPAAPGSPPEPVKKSIFKAKKAAEPAAAAAGAAAGAGGEGAGASAGNQPSLDELKETLSGLAANPDIPITEDEFQKAVEDPQFAAKLAAAEAELQAELEAELEAELAAESEG